MTSCHECGSDVAETDVFCPFCGISLRPVALEDEKSDLSFESTIVMQPTGASKPVAAALSPDLGASTTPPQETPATAEASSPLEAKNELRDLRSSDPGEETTLEDIQIGDSASLGDFNVSEERAVLTSFEKEEPSPDLLPASHVDISQVPVPNALEAL